MAHSVIEYHAATPEVRAIYDDIMATADDDWSTISGRRSRTIRHSQRTWKTSRNHGTHARSMP